MISYEYEQLTHWQNLLGGRGVKCQQNNCFTIAKYVAKDIFCTWMLWKGLLCCFHTKSLYACFRSYRRKDEQRCPEVHHTTCGAWVCQTGWIHPVGTNLTGFFHLFFNHSFFVLENGPYWALGNCIDIKKKSQAIMKFVRKLCCSDKIK